MVEFFETDMAGIMHFSNFFRFMESAEHAFYRSIGFSVDEAKSLGLGWPRVRAECEYLYPPRFEDIVEIRVRVRRLGTRSITLEFQFSKTEEGREISVASGAIRPCALSAIRKPAVFFPGRFRKNPRHNKPMQPLTPSRALAGYLLADDRDLVGRLWGAAAYGQFGMERFDQWRTELSLRRHRDFLTAVSRRLNSP